MSVRYYLDDIVWDRIGDKWLVGRIAAALFTATAIASVGVSVVIIRLDKRSGRRTLPATQMTDLVL